MAKKIYRDSLVLGILDTVVDDEGNGSYFAGEVIGNILMALDGNNDYEIVDE